MSVPAVAAHPSAASAAADAALIRKVSWRVMPLIMVGYFFAFFDRINIGFAKAQLQVDLGLSNTAYGLGASLFVVGYVLLEVPSNLMLYRIGARVWLARIMVSWGLATAAMVFVSAPWHFYGLRFLIGALEAGFAPGVLYYLTLWFPAAHRGRITTLLFLASAFSGIIGAPLAGLILSGLDGVMGLPGWNWLFLFGGLPCVAHGLLLLRFLDNNASDAKWLDEGEKRQLAASVSRVPPGRRGHSLLSAIGTPGFLLLGLVYFLIQIASYGLNFWAPDLIRTAGGGSPAVVGMLSAVPYLCGAILMIVIGRSADATGERRLYVVACLILAAVGFVLAGLAHHHVGLMVLALALVGAGVVASVPSFWALPPKLLVGAGAAGGIALINTLGQLGGIVSPIMVGRVKDHSGSATLAMYLIAALCIVCAGILYFAAPPELRVSDRTE